MTNSLSNKWKGNVLSNQVARTAVGSKIHGSNSKA